MFLPLPYEIPETSKSKKATSFVDLSTYAHVNTTSNPQSPYNHNTRQSRMKTLRASGTQTQHYIKSLSGKVSSLDSRGSHIFPHCRITRYIYERTPIDTPRNEERCRSVMRAPRRSLVTGFNQLRERAAGARVLSLLILYLARADDTRSGEFA